MIHIIPYIFRAFFYVLFGLSMEVIFSATLLKYVLGFDYPPVKIAPVYYMGTKALIYREGHREGFVSLYMIPLYALGILFAFEPLVSISGIVPWYIRFFDYAFCISGMECIYGFILKHTLGFYPWDYYKGSRYKIFKEGYTLATLIPFWGLCGLILEQYCRLMIHLSPYVLTAFFHYDTI